LKVGVKNFILSQVMSNLVGYFNGPELVMQQFRITKRGWAPMSAGLKGEIFGGQAKVGF
jgi:3-dehydroquinate synthetase